MLWLVHKPSCEQVANIAKMHTHTETGCVRVCVCLCRYDVHLCFDELHAADQRTLPSRTASRPEACWYLATLANSIGFHKTCSEIERSQAYRVLRSTPVDRKKLSLITGCRANSGFVHAV